MSPSNCRQNLARLIAHKDVMLPGEMSPPDYLCFGGNLPPPVEVPPKMGPGTKKLQKNHSDPAVSWRGPDAGDPFNDISQGIFLTNLKKRQKEFWSKKTA
jgi:hypothetical protein